jgi:hypothetical protein
MGHGTGKKISIPSLLFQIGSPNLDRLLRILAPDEFYAVSVIDFLINKLTRHDGPILHRHLGEWLRTGTSSETALRHWVKENLGAACFRTQAFNSARTHAEQCLKQGFWGAVWDPAGFAPGAAPACPQVLFGYGRLSPGRNWVAVFNSRKERLPSPESNWLKTLRLLLPAVASQPAGLASSLGILTYDLVTAYADRHDLPLFLVTTSGADADGKDLMTDVGRNRERIGVTCMTTGRCCQKATRMACRDRLLALLSDLHVLIEIRSGGNLLKTLREQQALQPRPQWVVVPSTRNAANEGNFQLAEEAAGRVHSVSIATPATEKNAPSPIQAGPGRRFLSEPLPWNEYVYHYTRSCPGPWPGQSHSDYLESLLEGARSSGHNALDTLSRILDEGRIRGGKRLVRGTDPVVSWSAGTPWELLSIRRWNRALIRWTFESYGIAVRRPLIRDRGGKPAIYAVEGCYQRISRANRFRFQRHEPPSCAWKHEREWRTEGDFELAGLGENEGFIFVPAGRDAVEIPAHFSWMLPIVVLDAHPNPK